jgi:DHA1 family tetracycline resistance protein-like MFS transporter
MLALGIMVPVLPRLVREMVGGDTAQAARMCGLFGSAWALMQFLCSPMVGALSDRFGRRPIALVSNFGQGLDYFFMALAPGISWLFVGRIISGITAASVSVGGAYIADITPPERRAKAFGLLGAAFNLGFIIGPAIGGFLGSYGPRVPFFVAGGCSLLNAIYGYFVLPESLPVERRATWSWKKTNPVASFILLGSHPMLMRLGFVAVLANVASEVLPHVSVLYIDYRYGWGPSTVGFIITVASLCSVLVQLFLVGPVVRRVGEARTLQLSLMIGSVGLTIYAAAWTGPMYLAGIVPLALWGAAGPVHQSLMTRYIREDQQGSLQGAQSSLWGVAGLIGPGVFTAAFASAISPGSWMPHIPGIPFYLAALFLLMAVGVSRKVHDTVISQSSSS